MPLVSARRGVSVFGMLLVLSGCVAVGSPRPAPYASAVPAATFESQTRVEIFFGLSKPGGTVSELEWQLFLRDVVTPRFPGLTIIEARGHYPGQMGPIEEPSRVLVLIYPSGEELDRAVFEVAEQYKTQFSQQSVLVVRDVVQVREVK